MSRKPKKIETPFVPKPLVARTENQKEVLRSIKYNYITFCSGPAGSGKTTLAVGSAVQFLRSKQVEKIIISRPIVEAAGERMGFLPGSAEDKIHPFLIPIYDELELYASKEEVHLWKSNKVLEICPLAHMRGRNFHQSFIILDEAQNSTYEQLKLALTRFGLGSKMVVVGDFNQSDLTPLYRGGFERICGRLSTVPGIGVCALQKCDIQRNPFIETILDYLD